jgi:hypothetical protein
MRNPAKLTLTSALVLLALAGLPPAMAGAFRPPTTPGGYYQTGSLQLTFSVDPLGTVDLKTGVATIGGVLSCSEPAVIDEFFGGLFQGHGARVTQGDFNLSGSGPCSGRWSATIDDQFAYANGVEVPAAYHPGEATFALQVEVIAGPDNGVLFPDVRGFVVLRPVEAAAG